MITFEGSEAFREVAWVLIEEIPRDGWHIGGQPFFGPPTVMGALRPSKSRYEAIDGTPTTRETWLPRPGPYRDRRGAAQDRETAARSRRVVSGAAWSPPNARIAPRIKAVTEQGGFCRTAPAGGERAHAVRGGPRAVRTAAQGKEDDMERFSPGYTADLLRHFADLRDGTHGAPSPGRTRNASSRQPWRCSIRTPGSRLNEINADLLLGTGEVTATDCDATARQRCDLGPFPGLSSRPLDQPG